LKRTKGSDGTESPELPTHPEDIDWSDAPPTISPELTYSLRRVGTQPVIGFITCETIVGLSLHFHKGRSKPHTKNGLCEACEAGNTPRWKGYMTLFDPRRKDHWLQEFTPSAYDGIRAGIDAFGGIKGHSIQLERTTHRQNSPMKSTVHIATLDLRVLPAAPNIIKVLYRIWDISESVNPPTHSTDRIGTYLKVDAQPNGRKP
jgi:hypothetical protein